MAIGSDISKLCMGCMSELDENGNCPNCEWQETDLPEGVHHLKPRTILNGKYIIGKVLGEGGFGITYIGLDINLEIKVAIKEYFPFGYVNRDTMRNTVMPLTGDGEEDYIKGLERFLDEAKRLARFNQLPGIVSVREFFTENETAYIVMEYLDGMTFKDYIQSQGGSISFSDVCTLISPVMESLAIVHAEGIVHRDISPDNLFITKNGQVKLIDFGAARMTNIDEKSLSVVLKPGFAPEEQYRRSGVQGPWTDIYSLAVTIYKAITGEMPPESLERLQEDKILLPSTMNIEIPPRAEAALIKALSVKASDRYQNISLFKSELLEEIPVCNDNDLTQQSFTENKSVEKKNLDNKEVSNAWIENKPVEKEKSLKTVMEKIKNSSQRKPIIIASSAALVLLLGFAGFGGYIYINNSHGNSRLAEKNYSAALNNFDNTLKVSKNNYTALVGKGEVLYNQKKYKEALDIDNKAVGLKADKFDGYYEKSKACIKLYKYEDALEAAKKAVSINSNNADALRCKAEASFYMFKLDDAMTDCNKALSINPNLKEANLLKGDILLITCKLSDAILSYNKAIELDPNYVEAYNGKGNAYSNMSKFDNAAGEYDKAVEKDKESLIIKCNKAAMLQFRGKASEAQKLFTDISTNSGMDDYLSLIAKAFAYENINKNDESEKYINKAIELNKWGIDALILKADLELSKNQVDNAEKTCKKALELYPNYFDAVKTMGRIYIAKSNWDEANKSFDKTIELLPDNYDNYIWKGKIKEGQGDYTAALNLYNKSVNIYPTALPYEFMGEIYFKQNNRNESIANYKKALDLGSKSREAIQRLGVLLIQVGDYEGAKNYNLKYISEFGANDVVYGNLAYNYDKLGDTQNALNYINKALETDSKNVNYINFKITMLLKLGKQDDAVAYAKACIDKGYITINDIHIMS